MSFPTIIWIAIGGGFGTLVRYLIASRLAIAAKPGFPYGTLAVNLIGCLLIGLIYGYFDRHENNQDNLKLILTIGFCGGFTTFSAFSADNLLMLREGQILPMIIYTVISVAGGLLLTYAGMMLFRQSA